MSRGVNIVTLCPSAPAAPGASMIAVVEQDGGVTNLLTPMIIDEEFVRSASAFGPLGKRFRFASPCQEGRCANWSGRECGLIGRLEESARSNFPGNTAPALPPCAIRAECRWWLQRGRDACLVCSIVVTDQRSPVVT